MSVPRKDGKLLLTFAWALTLTRTEFDNLTVAGAETGLLVPPPGEFASAEKFFGLTGIRRTAIVEDLFEIVAGGRVLPTRVVLGWHERYEALTVLVSVRIAETVVTAEEIDLTIAVLQSFQGRPGGNGDGEVHGRFRGERYASARDALSAAMTAVNHGPQIELVRYGWCAELRAHHGGPAAATARGLAKPLYGLAEADEGWRFVNEEWAATRLGQHWGSRDFFAIYATDNGALCINNKGGDYVEHQRAYTQRHRGRVEPFFELDSATAGLDHGVLFFVERVLMQLARADQWLRQARQVMPGKPRRVLITSGQSLRRSLNDVVRLLDLLVPPEIGALERKLESSMGLERLINRLDRQAEAIDEESRHVYQVRMNFLIAILTFVTILLAVLQVVVPLVTGK